MRVQKSVWQPGMVITAQQAEKMLRDDVAKFEGGVSSLVTAPTTQGQFDAMEKTYGLEHIVK